MIQNKTLLIKKVGEREYALMCNPDSPLVELHDVISIMKAYVADLILEANKNANEEVKDGN